MTRLNKKKCILALFTAFWGLWGTFIAIFLIFYALDKLITSFQGFISQCCVLDLQLCKLYFLNFLVPLGHIKAFLNFWKTSVVHCHFCPFFPRFCALVILRISRFFLILLALQFFIFFPIWKVICPFFSKYMTFVYKFHIIWKYADLKLLNLNCACFTNLAMHHAIWTYLY